MKKETLLEIILGTIGGLIFAIGMCMCLIPEWNMFRTGVVVTIIGFIVLLGIIPVYRSAHPKKEKEHKEINWGNCFNLDSWSYRFFNYGIWNEQNIRWRC